MMFLVILAIVLIIGWFIVINTCVKELKDNKDNKDEPFIEATTPYYPNDNRYTYCMCPKCHSKNTHISYYEICDVYTCRECGYSYVKGYSKHFK